MREPACFGIPSIFSFKSEVCQACSNTSKCQVSAHSALLALKNLPIVTDILNEHNNFAYATALKRFPSPARVQITKPTPTQRKDVKPRYALTEEQLEVLESQPKKVKAFLTKIWSLGEEKGMLDLAKSGINPFNENKNRPYHLAYEKLTQGKLSRLQLSTAIMDELGWSYASAYSQVSMIWRVLPCLNLAHVNQAFMTINRFSAENEQA